MEFKKKTTYFFQISTSRIIFDILQKQNYVEIIIIFLIGFYIQPVHAKFFRRPQLRHSATCHFYSHQCNEITKILMMTKYNFIIKAYETRSH